VLVVKLNFITYFSCTTDFMWFRVIQVVALCHVFIRIMLIHIHNSRLLDEGFLSIMVIHSFLSLTIIPFQYSILNQVSGEDFYL
jgi:hypothetical protein